MEPFAACPGVSSATVASEQRRRQVADSERVNRKFCECLCGRDLNVKMNRPTVICSAFPGGIEVKQKLFARPMIFFRMSYKLTAPSRQFAVSRRASHVSSNSDLEFGSLQFLPPHRFSRSLAFWLKGMGTSHIWS